MPEIEDETPNRNSDVDPGQNYSTLFYVHHSDSLKMCSIPTKFDGNGYSECKRAMLTGLFAKKNSVLLMEHLKCQLSLILIIVLGKDAMIC